MQNISYNTIKVFHHNDLDGRASAAIIATKFGWDDIDFIEMNYPEKFPITSINKGDTVWIVDYHILLEEMKQLLSITTDVHWIDHHASAIKDYENFNKKVRGLATEKYAGCVLTFIYCSLMDSIDISDWREWPEEYIDADTAGVPQFIRYIGDYDTKTLQYQDTRPFFFGLNSIPTKPANVKEDGYNIWVLLMNWDANTTSYIIEKGKSICDYRKLFLKEYFDSYGFITKFEGYSTAVVNVSNFGDEALWPAQGCVDILMTFVYSGNDDKWKFSLYSEKVDVSVIASKRGGGGHPGASGFSLSNKDGYALLGDLSKNRNKVIK